LFSPRLFTVAAEQKLELPASLPIPSSRELIGFTFRDVGNTRGTTGKGKEKEK
jgi:hypothetical protein